ncbi:hypothetical protein JIN84_09000 [Luteolibacter yonseiensis]|uniref:Uncharacterized protein n=1 Tax=Luteolibacter yonseiensis TaxID=1144680 RepID=A0A934VA19_9BACT|nr:hypothetical protein [Luteolibacter yonseiensis]MBK1815753.1 hypothetical protein [Luteolibacter yonseiensis]
MKRKGPDKGSKVRGNPNGKTLSPTSKTVTSEDMLEHMGIVLRLMKDAASTQRHHVSRLRKELGLPPNAALPDAVGDKDGHSRDYFPTVPEIDGDTLKDVERKEAACGLLLEEGSVIAGLRIYRAKAGSGEDDAWLAKSIPVEGGREWVNHNKKLIKERATYSELNRLIVTAGEAIGERKGEDVGRRKEKIRYATSPLKTITARLMPHEAEILFGSLSGNGLDRAMDSLKKDFEHEIGCEVASMAVHRMRNNDLHVHVQYTMVLEVEMPKKAYGPLKNEWEKKAVDCARQSLFAEGKRDFPAAVGKRKKLLIEQGVIPPPPKRTRFEKQKGNRNLKTNSLLGYSFKFKLNMLRAAQAFPEETELAEKIAQRGDKKGDFRDKFLFRTDEEIQAERLDYWLERRWRESVAAEVPEEIRARLPAAALEEARKYAIHGTTQVEAFHLELHRDATEKQLVDSETQLTRILDEAADLEIRMANLAAELQRQNLALDQRVIEVEGRENSVLQSENDAELRGVRAAFGKLFPESAPVANTPEGIIEEIKIGIEDAAQAAVENQMLEALEPPSLEAVAEKMGFGPEPNAEGLFRLPEGGLHPERVLITDRTFVRSFPTLGMDSPQKGEGVVELLATEETRESIKRSRSQLLAQLLKWFPNKAIALANEALGDRAGKFLRELLHLDAPKTPAKKAGLAKKAKDDSPDGNDPSSHEGQ